MAKLKMTIEGVDELKDAFGNVAPTQARSILRQAVHGLAGKVRDTLKPRLKKRTGKLQRSIKAVRRRGSADHPVSEVRGGADAPHLIIDEFGTSKMKAHPAIVPTVEEYRPKLKEEYRKEFFAKLEKSLARAARKRGE